MLSDATSSVVTQFEDWFTVSTLVSPYSHPGWKRGQGVFAGFFFDDEDAYMIAGAFSTPAQGAFAYAFSESSEIAIKDFNDAGLREAIAPELDTASTGRQYEFRYGTRIWSGEEPAPDIEWVLMRLEIAAGIWSGDGVG